MPTVYFARTGSDPNRASTGQFVPLETLSTELAEFEYKFVTEPPQINSDERPSPFSPYTQVVVHVEEGEVCARFPKAGYYWFFSLRPAECQQLLGLQPPPL